MCDIMGVISWSLGWLALGVHPTCRHDDEDLEWHRKKMAGKAMLTKAALCEVRGDWKYMGETFGFPKHNTNEGICWTCHCKPDEVLHEYIM